MLIVNISLAYRPSIRNFRSMALSSSVSSSSVVAVSSPAVRKRRLGRPSRKRIAGRESWLSTLVKSGRARDARLYAEQYHLDGYLQALLASNTSVDTCSDGTNTGETAQPDGGEGGQPDSGDNYNYKSTQEVRILQSGGKLTLGVAAIREVAGAIALAGDAAASGGSSAAQETAQELHSPDGESEGNRGFGQADREAKKAAYASSWGESRWVEEGEGLVGKVCRNKQYNELRLPGKEGGGELWTKVANWDWRNGLVRGERVWVKRTWLSADDTDSEYVVVRRMDVNEGVESEPVTEVVAEAESVAAAKPVTAAAEDAIDNSHVLPQFLKQDTVFPRKPESADEYITRIREQASQWANGLAP